ncbi:hypothetical protein [Streptomyces calvus]
MPADNAGHVAFVVTARLRRASGGSATRTPDVSAGVPADNAGHVAFVVTARLRRASEGSATRTPL